MAVLQGDMLAGYWKGKINWRILLCSYPYPTFPSFITGLCEIFSPPARWPGKTRLELWLELGVRGMPKQYLEWDWKLARVKVIYVNFLVSVPFIWSCIYLSSFLVSKADSGAYQQGCQSRVGVELSFLCVLPVFSKPSWSLGWEDGCPRAALGILCKIRATTCQEKDLLLLASPIWNLGIGSRERQAPSA